MHKCPSGRNALTGGDPDAMPPLVEPPAPASGPASSRRRVRRRKKAKKPDPSPASPQQQQQQQQDQAPPESVAPRLRKVRRRKVRKARKEASPGERRPTSAAVTMRRLRHRARADNIRDVTAAVEHEQVVFKEALRQAQGQRARAEAPSAHATRLDTAIGEMEAHLGAMDTFLSNAREREQAAERRAANAGAPDEEDEEDPEFEMPEGEPSEEWTNAQLHKYCEQVNIEIKASATKAELLEAINKAD